MVHGTFMVHGIKHRMLQTFVSTVFILQEDSPDDDALLGRAAKLLGVLLRI